MFCDQQSFKYLRLDGQTPVGKRQELVQRFNDKHIHDCKFMNCFCLFVCFVALRPKSTAMVMAGRSVHLTTLSPGQA